MGRTVRTVATLLFVGIIVAIGLCILYFGTSLGLVSGGNGSSLGGATAKAPYYAQIGWLRNTAPWPVTITSITTNAAHNATEPVVYLERKHGVAGTKSAIPDWTKKAAKPPYDMVGGSLRYLGFALMPEQGHIASFSSYTVNFSGPLGFHFSKTFPGTIVAARSNTLPASLLAPDPASDSTSLSAYIVALSAALDKKNPAALAVVMGGDATPADAQAFLKQQKGFSLKYLSSTVPTEGNPDSSTLTYYKDSIKNALPPIHVAWAGYRWSVVRG